MIGNILIRKNLSFKGIYWEVGKLLRNAIRGHTFCIFL